MTDQRDKELVRAIENSNVLCLCIISTDKKLIFANKAMKILLKGKPEDSFINPSLSQLLEETKSEPFEGLITIGDLKSINTSIQARVVQQENELIVTGEIDVFRISKQNTSLSALNREISNLQRQLIKEKKMLEVANHKLEELNHNQNLMLGTAAHDIRSPISTAFSLADLITESSHYYNEKEILGFVKNIKDNTNYALKLLNGLLDLSSIKSGKIKLDLQKADYIEFVNKVVDNNTIFANSKDIKIIVKSELEKCTILFDQIRIEQVLNNLLSNAIKYSEPESEVMLRISEFEDKIKTEVIDEGPGIKQEEIEKLFKPFSKTTNKPSNGEKSTGLGLAIAKKVIDLHGGEISVASKKSKGSNFIFLLKKD